MNIRIINKVDEYEAVRDNWNFVYSNDKKATVFQSWEWLRGWFDVIAENWLIIAVKPESETNYVAFIPLFKESISGKYGIKTHDTIRMAGEPLCDYTGLLCLPQYEDNIIEYFAHYLQNDIHWSQLKLRDVFDQRLPEILQQFEKKKYSIQYKKETVCPRLYLPDSWELYMQNTIDTKFSKKLTSKMKKADKKGCYTSSANDNNIELYVQYYIQLHEMRWGKMENRMRELYVSTFKWAYYSKLLRIDVLWFEDVPVAIQVSFLDNRNKIFHFYNGGWNPDYAHLSPGIVLHGHCIKYAIENGYKIYDFMRGDEGYKYLFGSVNEYNKNIVVTVNTIETKLRKFKNRILKNAATG